jgi:hypothetical protein
MNRPLLSSLLLACSINFVHAAPPVHPALGGGPVNDLCGGVTPVPLATGDSLTFIGDNTNATFTGDAVPGNLLDQYPFPNTWHAITTAECADVTVSYCGTDSGWSNVWKLLTTGCPADSIIYPSVQDTTTCANGNWTFTFTGLAAGTYWLPVPNVGFGQGGGPYQVAVTAMACGSNVPANDLCGDVTPEALSMGGTLTFTGDNTNATFAGDAVAGNILDQYPSPNTWHAFTTGECADVTVSYCGTNSGWSNVWKLLTTDCPADSIIYPSVQETTTCANGNWTFSFTGLAAGTYWLPVPNVGFGQGGGPYQVEVTAMACGSNVPANDLCGDVTPEALSMGGTLTFTGDNTSATFAGDAVAGNILDQYPSPNTWHAFTTVECADVTVSYCGTNSGWSNVWKLLTTDCPADSIINPSAQETTTCANGNWTFSFTGLPAGTYLLPVPNVGFGQGGGAYSITVSAALCAGMPPANDLCGGVSAVALAVDDTLQFTGDNTNATFAGDAVPGSVLDQTPLANTWHAFTTTGCADVTVSYCGTDSGWSSVWKLLTTACPADSCIFPTAQDTTTCGNGNWTFSFDNLLPGTYWLPVPNVGFGQGGGPYDVAVSAVDCAVGMEARDDVAPWRIWPNPTDGELYVSTAIVSGPVQLELLDMAGRTAWGATMWVTAGTPSVIHFGSGMAAGTYLLRITTAAGRAAKPVVLR